MPEVKKKFAGCQWKKVLCSTLHSALTYLLFPPLSAIGSRTLNSIKPHLPHTPSHTTRYGIYFLCSPLFYSTSLYKRVCVCESLWSSYQIGRKCFPGPICLPCLPASSAASVSGQGSSSTRQETCEWPLHTGKPLPDPTQTDTYPPSSTTTTTPPPTPLCFQPTTQLCIPCSHWLDSCSLTTPPCWDRLAAVPFPGWPRARQCGI